MPWSGLPTKGSFFKRYRNSIFVHFRPEYGIRHFLAPCVHRLAKFRSTSVAESDNQVMTVLKGDSYQNGFCIVRGGIHITIKS
mmetsp:Transcript_152918/g.284924  ORF Transcript_152918/g.284924 Transcript_152918/m.284924 type:complete len:83 (+) Transcript_152918:2605-2853(+)